LALNCTASGEVPVSGSASISAVGSWLAAGVTVTGTVAVTVPP
jgi:hypothetical protein